MPAAGNDAGFPSGNFSPRAPHALQIVPIQFAMPIFVVVLAKPRNLKRLGIVVVVGLRVGSTAALTRLPMHPSSKYFVLHQLMDVPLITVGVVPFAPGIGTWLAHRHKVA